MSEIFDHQEPWVIFKINNQTFAIPSHSIREMITIPDVTPIPRAPDYVRGVINLRGSVIALIDLRLKLNQHSAAQDLDDLIAALEDHKKEHIDWLNALQKHVEAEDGSVFELTPDPHLCGFGKWYARFQPNNPRLSSLMANFDTPHKAIHAAAKQTEDLLRRGQKDKALQLTETVRKIHLSKMLELFDEVKKVMHNLAQEIAVVVEHSDTIVALTVDMVDAVEPLRPGSMEELPGNMGADSDFIVHGLARRSSNNDPVLLPDLGRIINDNYDLSHSVRLEGDKVD
jgi:chemotaxis signal transduction protein